MVLVLIINAFWIKYNKTLKIWIQTKVFYYRIYCAFFKILWSIEHWNISCFKQHKYPKSSYALSLRVCTRVCRTTSFDAAGKCRIQIAQMWFCTMKRYVAQVSYDGFLFKYLCKCQSLQILIIVTLGIEQINFIDYWLILFANQGCN